MTRKGRMLSAFAVLFKKLDATKNKLNVATKILRHETK